MKRIAIALQVLLGAIFILSGSNGFFNYMPMPPLPEPAANFMGALVRSGYLFYLLKTTELTCGVLLVSGFFVPLALTVLAPVILNIILFHIFLDPPGIALGLVATVLELFLAFYHRQYFKGVLTLRV